MATSIASLGRTDSREAVSAYWNHWPCVFPQHGRAGKHSRAIRYFFTNRSTDILRLFRETCATSGIPFRLSSPTTISIARRDAVSALDRFIGPKS